jgi:DNA-directed RNA polymerase I subunit RPA1
MTASQKPKTPSMTMKVRPGISPHDISIFCKRASRITLSQIVDDVVVHEQLQVEGEARRTHFTVNINFYPKHEYQEEHDLQPAEILAAFGVKFPSMLKKEILNEVRKLDADLKSQMAQLGQGKRVRSKEGEGDEDEDIETSRKKDTDEESEAGVGDADEEKDSKQKKQQATYESDDEDDGEVDKSDNDDAHEAAASDDDGLVGEESSLKKLKSTSFKSLVDRVSGFFQRNFQQAIAFDFDESQCTFKVEVSLFFKLVIL